MPGLGAYKEQKQLIVAKDVFVQHGYTVVVFDPSHSVGESEGLYEDATMTGYYNDFEDLIAWSSTQDWYREPFVVCGHSLGGYSSLAYAEKYPEKVSAVVSLAPVISGQLSHEAQQRYSKVAYDNWRATGWDERVSNSKPGVIKRLKWSHMEDRLKHDLYPDISQLVMPVFMIAASEDTSCPLDQIKTFFDKIPAVNKDLKVILDAPHTWKTESDLNVFKKYLDECTSKI